MTWEVLVAIKFDDQTRSLPPATSGPQRHLDAAGARFPAISFSLTRSLTAVNFTPMVLLSARQVEDAQHGTWEISKNHTLKDFSHQHFADSL